MYSTINVLISSRNVLLVNFGAIWAKNLFHFKCQKKHYKWDYNLLKEFGGKKMRLLESYKQQPSPLLYSIDIWPARNSSLTQRET